MRIRRNPSRMLGLSFCTAAQVEPKAPPSEAPVLLRPLPHSHIDSPAVLVLPAATSLEVCLQSYAWNPHPHALNYEELNNGLVGDAWREPRKSPGLADIDVDFVLHQQEVETEDEVEEEIFLLKKKKVGDKVEKQEQVNEKLRQDGNQEKGPNKKMMAKVITAKKPSKCKKTDGRKWKCGKDAVVPHTLCEKHFHQSRSYYDSRKEAPGGSSKSAPEKAPPISNQAKASSSSKKRTRASAPSSSTQAALVSDVPPGSKAASSKLPRKKEEDDYSGGAFYYPEPFGPFRGKQRSHYSSSNRVEATTSSTIF